MMQTSNDGHFCNVICAVSGFIWLLIDFDKGLIYDVIRQIDSELAKIDFEI